MKRHFVHRNIRRLIQIVFFAFFLYIMKLTENPKDFIFRIDPLILFINSLALRNLINISLLSLFLLVLTIIFGRFFCGFICPLGTLIDIGEDTLICHIRKERKLILSPHTKFLVLLFLFIAGLFGISLAYHFDPLIIFERVFNSFHPVVLIVLVLILLANLLNERFWCRHICALGGILSILSHFSFFKLFLAAGCRRCEFCNNLCPTGAIKAKDRLMDFSNCILCLRCKYECPEGIIKYRIGFTGAPFQIERRSFFIATAGALIGTQIIKGNLYKNNKRLIRPPGSIPEIDFLNTCIRCGRCIGVCPTHGLQPCFLEAGINGLWTPRLVPRIGGCERYCNRCGQVCPTSAIRNLPLAEKTFVIIGLAIIDRSRCIAWEEDKVCLICDEVCPYNAIRMFSETLNNITLSRPYVDEKICTGCGLCEHSCPVDGESAIKVFAYNQERKKSGSYITEEKIRWRKEGEAIEELPSGFIIE